MLINLIFFFVSICLAFLLLLFFFFVQLIKVWCNETLHHRYGSNLSASGLDLLWSSVVSIFLIGGAVGSLGGAKAANKFGRLVAHQWIC